MNFACRYCAHAIYINAVIKKLYRCIILDYLSSYIFKKNQCKYLKKNLLIFSFLSFFLTMYKTNGIKKREKKNIRSREKEKERKKKFGNIAIEKKLKYNIT